MHGIPDADFERLATLINSDDSPVGIDAKTTHVLILYKLEQLERRIERLEQARGATEAPARGARPLSG